jgi:Ca2+-binding EF-hand superfamily protein
MTLLLVWLGQSPVNSSYVKDVPYHKKDEFYTRKLESYFTASDADRDGCLSENDYGDMGHKFIYLVKMRRYDAYILLNKKIPKIWDTFTYDAEGSGRPANLTEMIDSIKARRYHSTLTTSLKKFVMQEFNVVDISRDGKLSPQEHFVYLKCRGVSDTKAAEKSFAAVDSNKDGCITPREFASSAVNYFTTDSENCPSKYFYGGFA